MSWSGVRIDPLDTLFCRDTRPMTAGTRSDSGLPAPQTWAGAVRTVLLKRHDADLERLGAATRAGASFAEACLAIGLPWIAEVRVRGPWLADRDTKPLLELPRDLRLDADGHTMRLRPRRQAPPGWIPPEEGMLPLWSSQPSAKQKRGFLTSNGLAKYLKGEMPAAADILPQAKLYDFETRVGLAIDPETQTAADGLLYSTSRLRLCPGICFYAEVNASDEVHPFAEPEPLFLGGEGRAVRVERTPGVFHWPEKEGERLAVLLTTAAPFQAAWRPDRLPGQLIAAAVGDPVSISGWDLARRGPKPTRFAVPPGSVYLCNGNTTGSSPLCSPEDAQLGYGHWLKGIWNYYE
jgi:CRISPR-associated protein Cmr3